jgi:hypothetical protein
MMRDFDAANDAGTKKEDELWEKGALGRQIGGLIIS